MKTGENEEGENGKGKGVQIGVGRSPPDTEEEWTPLQCIS